MTQHEHLHLLRGGRAAQQQDQPNHLPEDQIQQPQRHDGERARASERAAHRWSTDVRDILEPHRVLAAFTSPVTAQRAMAERAGSTTVEVAASHAVYVSQPEAVANLVRQAASARHTAPA